MLYSGSTLRVIRLVKIPPADSVDSNLLLSKYPYLCIFTLANPNITDMTEEDAADLQFPKGIYISWLYRMQIGRYIIELTSLPWYLCRQFNKKMWSSALKLVEFFIIAALKAKIWLATLYSKGLRASQRRIQSKYIVAICICYNDNIECDFYIR